MKFYLSILIFILLAFFHRPEQKTTHIFLIGDSTVADYSLESDYQDKRFPLNGWGQVFQSYFKKDSLKAIKNVIKTDSVIVIDKAKGGRSTRTFFEEGRWAEVFKALKKNDLVMIQFGHNDAAIDKPENGPHPLKFQPSGCSYGQVELAKPELTKHTNPHREGSPHP